jgi:hypothetical protein
MCPKRLVLPLVSLFFVSIAAGSPQTAAPDVQALQFCQRALAALTGTIPISDATLTGRARRIAGSNDESGAVVLKATAAGNARMDISLPSGSRTEIQLSSTATSGSAGSWSRADGVLHTVANHNLFTDSSWFFPSLLLARLVSSQDVVLSLAGQETRNGQSVIHVAASRGFPGASPRAAALLQHLSQMDVYLDPSTLLPVALAFNTHPDADAGQDIPVEIHFSDYRLVNGVQMPFHVQKFLNNGLVLDLQFDSAAFNTGLSATDFEAR